MHLVASDLGGSARGVVERDDVEGGRRGGGGGGGGSGAFASVRDPRADARDESADAYAIEVGEGREGLDVVVGGPCGGGVPRRSRASTASTGPSSIGETDVLAEEPRADVDVVVLVVEGRARKSHLVQLVVVLDGVEVARGPPRDVLQGSGRAHHDVLEGAEGPAAVARAVVRLVHVHGRVHAGRRRIGESAWIVRGDARRAGRGPQGRAGTARERSRWKTGSASTSGGRATKRVHDPYPGSRGRRDGRGASPRSAGRIPRRARRAPQPLSRGGGRHRGRHRADSESVTSPAARNAENQTWSRRVSFAPRSFGRRPANSPAIGATRDRADTNTPTRWRSDTSSPARPRCATREPPRAPSPLVFQSTDRIASPPLPTLPRSLAISPVSRRPTLPPRRAGRRRVLRPRRVQALRG